MMRRLNRTVTTLLIAFALAMATTASFAAEPATLDGAFVQGGLVLGRVAPDSEVFVDGRAVRVGQDGVFVFGFGRDHGPRVEFTVRHGDGEEERRVLRIKRRDYDIQRIDGLPPKMVTPSEADLARIRREAKAIAEARRIDTAEAMFRTGWIWPTKGRITGVYGSQRILNGEPRRPHFGVDIAAPTGTPVVAPADGIARLAEPDLYFTGGTIVLDHGHGVSSAFSHLSDIHIAVGERVRRGDVIATVGSTGRSTGAHLDWRINWFDERLDPALLAGPMATPDGGN